MADESRNDPLEGFQIDYYEEKTREVTIRLRPSILKNRDSMEKMAQTAVDIILGGPNVRTVRILVRYERHDSLHLEDVIVLGGLAALTCWLFIVLPLVFY